MSSLRIGVVGAGLVGSRRADVVKQFNGTEMAMVADVNLERAQQVAARCGARAISRWEEIVNNNDIQVVIVSTPHHLLAPIGLAAIQNKKHVLCEKPMGRDPEEVSQLVSAAKAQGVRLKAGLNHRFHPAISKAYQLYSSGAIGEIVFVRGRYGHGGRPGYEREWRGNKSLAGGGELLDQGIHLIDLARWFLGEFYEVAGFTITGFWDIAPLEDNVFFLLRTMEGQVASFHASWTQWKNLFSFEIFGREGYLLIEGLGGSYGVERLVFGKRKPTGIPEESIWEFSGPDPSWFEEWREFVSAIIERRDPHGSGKDGWEAIRIVNALYRAAESGSVVRL